jgi:hypothetical protein
MPRDFDWDPEMIAMFPSYSVGEIRHFTRVMAASGDDAGVSSQPRRGTPSMQLARATVHSPLVPLHDRRPPLSFRQVLVAGATSVLLLGVTVQGTLQGHFRVDLKETVVVLAVAWQAQKWARR